MDTIFEKQLFDFLYENGLCLSSENSTKVIRAGVGEKDWTVVDYDEINGKDYQTLKRALKRVNP